MAWGNPPAMLLPDPSSPAERGAVAQRDSFLLRIDGKLLGALRKWSEDEMRSTNSQIEFLLRKALSEAGRLPKPASPTRKAPRDAIDASPDAAADSNRE